MNDSPWFVFTAIQKKNYEKLNFTETIYHLYKNVKYKKFNAIHRKFILS